LFLLLAGAWWLVASNESQYRITLSSTWELWTDVIRDVDNFGLLVTRVSDREEMEFGRKIAAAFQKTVIADEKLQKYVNEVGGALTPHVRRKGIAYQFHIVDIKVIDAFAIPGGHIYVTRRMLDFLHTEAEFAALLGHEIAHVDLRHCIDRFQYQLQLQKVVPGDLAAIAELAYSLLTVGYSKQHEHEADVQSVMLTAEARYHPKHAISLDDHLRDLEGVASGARKPPKFMVEELTSAVFAGLRDYFATHPATGDRIVEMSRTLAKNEPEWGGKLFYSGRSNHAERISRASSDRSAEWRSYEEPPAFGAYLTDQRYTAFKAFAAHLPSGLSAIAADEATPEKAMETALSECESKMKPCQLYALGDSLVLGKTKEQIGEEATEYVKAICDSKPAKHPIEKCVGGGAPNREETPKPGDGDSPPKASGGEAAAPLLSESAPSADAVEVEDRLRAFLDGGPGKEAVFGLDQAFFDSGQTDLTASSHEQLHRLAKILVGFPKTRIAVVVHSGAGGDKAKNAKLSLDRAKSVKADLVRFGVGRSLVTLKGEQEEPPPLSDVRVQDGHLWISVRTR
jgi:outer membrane protein OmpA-like peptidoglycan-associated protein